MTTLNLNALPTFVTIVDSGSFSAAAERLGISKALVTKHLADLEQLLGVKLAHRTTRKLGLTPAGTLFYARCKEVLADAEGAVREVEQFRDAPGGHVRISTAIAFGRLHLMPAIAHFLRAHPDITAEVHLTDRFADLVTGGEDIVIRSADMPRLRSLVARRLAPWRWALCASPEYLSRHPAPDAPADLVHHDCIVYTSNVRGAWHFRHGDARETVHVKGRFKANNADGVLQAVLAGIGVGVIPTMAAAEDLATGRLARLLPGYALPEGVLYAAYLPNPTMSRSVRTLVSFLVEAFGEDPPWDRRIDARAQAGGTEAASAPA